MANTYVKRCSMAVAICEMQIKKQNEIPLKPIMLAIIIKSDNNKCREIGDFLHTVGNGKWCSCFSKVKHSYI